MVGFPREFAIQVGQVTCCDVRFGRIERAAFTTGEYLAVFFALAIQP